jgi:hypothetical protein
MPVERRNEVRKIVWIREDVFITSTPVFQHASFLSSIIFCFLQCPHQKERERERDTQSERGITRELQISMNKKKTG